MKRLIKWWRAEPKVKQRETPSVEPVTIASVESADVPNKAIEAETKAALADLVQGVLHLGRSSYDLRMALGRSTLANLNGAPRK